MHCAIVRFTPCDSCIARLLCTTTWCNPCPGLCAEPASLSRARMPMRDRRADEAIQQNRRWLAL